MIYTIIIKYFNYSCQRIEVLSMSFIKKHKVIFIILLFLILIGLTLFLSLIHILTVARVVGKLSWSCQPRQVVRSPWGSASMSRTFFPRRARPMPRFTVVVVLPVPPFWLASAITRLSLGRLLCSGIFMSSFFIDLAARWQDGRLCMGKSERWA